MMTTQVFESEEMQALYLDLVGVLEKKQPVPAMAIFVLRTLADDISKHAQISVVAGVPLADPSEVQ